MIAPQLMRLAWWWCERDRLRLGQGAVAGRQAGRVWHNPKPPPPPPPPPPATTPPLHSTLPSPLPLRPLLPRAPRPVHSPAVTRRRPNKGRRVTGHEPANPNPRLGYSPRLRAKDPVVLSLSLSLSLSTTPLSSPIVCPIKLPSNTPTPPSPPSPPRLLHGHPGPRVILATVHALHRKLQFPGPFVAV